MVQNSIPISGGSVRVHPDPARPGGFTSQPVLGQRLGWFDVTGIERAVWGARDNWAKFGWPYRLLKGVAVVQDQNYSPHQEVDLYIVRSLTRDGKLLEITAVANNAKDTQEAAASVRTDPTLRYPRQATGLAVREHDVRLRQSVHFLWKTEIQREALYYPNQCKCRSLLGGGSRPASMGS